MQTLSDVYDEAMRHAFNGGDFEVFVSRLALGETCSDRYLERYDAAERGAAEGIRLAASFEFLDMLNDMIGEG